MAAATRPYQVVVWGASGFTGRLVCEHIARDYAGSIRWAMAGRDARKLEAVREELARINPSVRDVPILIADAMDKAALGTVMRQTQVVLALAGPFAKYGDLVVEQAVEQGTHYCDSTGEIPWVKRTIQAHDATARAKGVKIVHCCGYDSVPSDLGALMMADYCQKTLGKQLDHVYNLVGKGKGGVSGGTIASAMNSVAAEPMSELIKVSTDAYYLLPDKDPRRGTDKPAATLPTFVKEAGVWAGPWIMEGVNAKVVHYSNAILPKGPYGPDFKFTEVIAGGKGWAGWAGASLISFGTTLIGIGFALAPARALLRRVLPAPGEGPSLDVQRTGFWNHTLVAVTHEPNGAKPTVVTGECGDRRDAGYWSTSRMILETGLALVLDADTIAKSGTCLPGGVLTPATAAGMVLVDRLRAAGFTFKVNGPVTSGTNGVLGAAAANRRSRLPAATSRHERIVAPRRVCVHGCRG